MAYWSRCLHIPSLWRGWCIRQESFYYFGSMLSLELSIPPLETFGKQSLAIVGCNQASTQICPWCLRISVQLYIHWKLSVCWSGPVVEVSRLFSLRYCAGSGAGDGSASLVTLWGWSKGNWSLSHFERAFPLKAQGLPCKQIFSVCVCFLCKMVVFFSQ